jgi:chorismate-pyruvate lyase
VASATTSRMPSGSHSLLAPLDRFYASAGLVLPVAEAVGDAELPSDARELLTPPGPLTPRLEDHHGEALTLRVLERRRSGDDYARRIVLLRSDGVPVVLGAIAVDLARLPPALRAAVVAERRPFGHIVAQGMAKPSALLRIARDAPIAGALELAEGEAWLYGRRRTVFEHRAGVIASIVEILAPPRERNRSSRSA